MLEITRYNASMAQSNLNSTKTLRLMLVDDHEVVRLGLKSLIQRFDKIDIVAEAVSYTHLTLPTILLV